MQLNRYPLITAESFITFEFISKGPKGEIYKLIAFQETDVANVYNLAFGDKNQHTGKLDDLSITHNSDKEQVLATVAFAVIVFTNRFPDASIYVEGSTAARTRLYQMGISRYHHEIKSEFIILGLKDESWEVFQQNVNYDCFVVKRKTLV
jgi:hypothetical protein